MLAQILLNIEHRLMNQAAAPCEYDSFTTMQKVEVFELSLNHTAGQDLYKVKREVGIVKRGPLSDTKGSSRVGRILHVRF